MSVETIERHTIACLAAELEALDNFLRGQGGVRVESENARQLVVTSSAAGRAFGFLEQRAKEFWWTVTRLAGLGHLHDGTAAAHPRLADRATWSGPAAPQRVGPRLLIDATRTHSNGLHTGVQRVTRKLAEFVTVSGEGAAVVQAGKRIVRFFKGSWPDDVTIEAGDVRDRIGPHRMRHRVVAPGGMDRDLAHGQLLADLQQPAIADDVAWLRL